MAQEMQFDLADTRAGDRREEAQRQAEANEPTFGQTFGAAIDLEWVSSAAIARYNRPEFVPDPEWKLDPINATALLKDRSIPTEYAEFLDEAHSQAHAEWIADTMKEELKQQELLARAGLMGTATRVGAAIIDPAGIALAIATGGVPALMAKGSRIQRIIRSGLAAGATNAALEGALASQQVTRDWKDVVIAGGIGFAFGGAIGGLTKAEQRAVSQLGKNVADGQTLKQVEEAGIELTDAGKAAVKAADEPVSLGADAASAVVRSGRRTSAAAAPEPEAPVLSPSVKAALRETDDEFLASLNIDIRNQGNRILDDLFPDRGRQPDVEPPKPLSPEDQAKADARLAREDEHWATKRRVDLAKLEASFLPEPAAPRQVSGDMKLEGGLQAALRKALAKQEEKIAKGDEAAKKEAAFLRAEIEEALKKEDDFAAMYRQRGEQIAAEVESPPFQYGSVGSAQAAVIPDAESAGVSHIRLFGKQVPIGFFGRFDSYSVIQRSDHPLMRALGNDLLLDNVGKVDGTAVRHTVSDHLELNLREHAHALYWAAQDPFKAWAKRKGLRWHQAWIGKQGEEFWTDVTRIVRGDKALAGANPEAASVAQQLASVQKRILDKMQQYGVDGAENVAQNPNYMMRRFNHEKLRDMIKTHGGTEKIEKVIAEAIKRVRQIDADKAARIAQTYLAKVQQIEWMNFRGGKMFASKSDKAVLRTALERQGLDPDEVDEVMDMLHASDAARKSEGESPRLKHRTIFDENFEMDGIRIDDMFENDARLLFDIYNRQTSGLIAFAKTGIRSEDDWLARIKEISDYAVAHPEIDGAKLAEHLEYIEDMRKALLGHPMSNQHYGSMERVQRTLANVNFARVLPQAGAAQVAEIGNYLNLALWRRMFQALPSVRDVIKLALNKRLDGEWVEDLAAITHFGPELALNKMMGRHVVEEGFLNSAGIGAAIEKAGRIGAVATSKISGLQAWTNINRHVTQRVFLNKLFRLGTDPDYLNKGRMRQKLATQGLEDYELEDVIEHMQTYGKTNSRGGLAGIDWETWSKKHPRSFENLQIATQRETNRVVQTHTIGETPRWMGSTLGKILTQFRTFPIVAFGKQLLYGMHHWDNEVVQSWIASSFFAGLSYIAQTYLNHANDRETLRERLTPASIALAAFQRASFSSLIPGMVDTFAQFGTGRQFFAHGRTSQLGSSFILGNPYYDLVGNKLLSTASLAARQMLVPGETMTTQRDVRNMIGIAPNILGMRLFTNAIIDDFPQRNFLSTQ